MRIFKNTIAIVLLGFTTIAVNAQDDNYDMEKFTQGMIANFEQDHYLVADNKIFNEGETIEVTNNGESLLIIILHFKPDGFTVKEGGPQVELYSHYSKSNQYNLQLSSNYYTHKSENSSRVYSLAYNVKANPQIKKVTIVLKNVKSSSRVLVFKKK